MESEQPVPVKEQIERIMRLFPWREFVLTRDHLLYERSGPDAVVDAQENARELLDSAVRKNLYATERDHLRVEYHDGWLELTGVLHMCASGWDEEEDEANASNPRRE